jgi:hypothetical protein
MTKTTLNHFSSIVNHSEGGLIKKNDRQFIFEFNNADRANQFVTEASLKSIKAIAYIPPSYVEIVGIIRGVPIQYTDSELLEALSTYDSVKINHVRRFNKISPRWNQNSVGDGSLTLSVSHPPKSS